MSSPKLTQDKQICYLQAMGIQAWVSREQPLAGVVENSVVENVVETIETTLEATIEKTEKSPLPSAYDDAPAQNQSSYEEISVPATSSIDVSQLDWPELQSTVSSCVACALHESRTNTVFGIGDHQAQVMVIGEAPGADEDQQGEPFVGPAGQLLNNMLLAIGYKREQVYIANILKCRPPGDRDPQPDEIAQCESYLKRQITMVKPKVILAVGGIAAHNLMKVETPIGKMRGKLYQYGDTPVVVTYHPAYLLRKPSEKARSWDDLRLALSIIRDEQDGSQS